MVRFHGAPPYRAAIVHGGPGAAGSCEVFARTLSHRCEMGVLEPLQSEYGLSGLLQELKEQLRDAANPCYLIGHSFGAWLAALYAAEHPQQICGLVLVGSGPFEDREVGRIQETRCKRLAQAGPLFIALDQALSNGCLTHAEQDLALRLMGMLAERSDDFDRLHDAETAPHFMPPSGQQYEAIWREAAALRTSGGLSKALSKIRCPVLVLHGKEDPHPVEGVLRPLKEKGADVTACILSQCGHSPFLERNAADAFYDQLSRFLAVDRSTLCADRSNVKTKRKNI